jgi:IAA-amino acid hydrolase
VFGIVVDICSGEGLCELLRADMDALPLVEETPLPPDLSDEHNAEFRSRHHSKMHACGHDGNMAMLLGAAYLIHKLNQQSAFPGTIRIIFQPAEEGGAGAYACPRKEC